MEIVTSWMEEGIEKGIERGKIEGHQEEARRFVLRLLGSRFGNLESGLRAAVGSLSTSQMEELGEAILYFHDLAEFENWLAVRKAPHGPQ